MRVGKSFVRRGLMVALSTALAAATSAAVLTPPAALGKSQARSAAHVGRAQKAFTQAKAARRAQVDEQTSPPELVQRTGTPDSQPVQHLLSSAWAGSHKFGSGNDWEPDVAADPSSDFAYVVTTRYGDRACPSCPNPALVYRASPDNGQTWGPTRYLCKCPAWGWQADPQMEVANDGTVYALILQGWGTYLTTSTDHGLHWSPLVDVAPTFNWTDHGFLTISDDGQDVYVAFSHGGSWVVASHDGGLSFADPVQTNTPGMNEYYYQYKGAVSGNSAWIAATAVTSYPYATGLVRYYVLHTDDGGVTWDQIKVATVKQQPNCRTPWNPTCHTDHFAGMSGLAMDPNGTIVYTYAGSTVAADGQQIYTITSTNGGLSWTPAQAISPEKRVRRRVIASFPIVVSGGVGDFRLTYMDDRRGLKRWNTWYSSSSDGGLTWNPDQRISDATAGAGYQHPQGYDADYGDYEGLAVMNDGNTLAAWGAGYSYYGPGGTWINRSV